MVFIIQKPKPLRLLDEQVLTTSAVWEKALNYAGNIAPGENALLKLTLVGGGGGGVQLGSSQPDQGTFAQCGFGGQIGRFTFDISVIGASELVVIGSGASPRDSTVGANGGYSSFGSWAKVGGGIGGGITSFSAIKPLGGQRANDGASEGSNYFNGSNKRRTIPGSEAWPTTSGRGGDSTLYGTGATSGLKGAAIIQIWGY